MSLLSRFITLLFLFSISQQCYCQEIPYYKQVVKTLSSDSLAGRGYTNKGIDKAKQYLLSEFKNCGLQAFDDNYLQTFNLSVNTFPEEIELSINGKTLTAAEDFLVDPGSQSISGTFKVKNVHYYDIVKGLEDLSKIKVKKNEILVINCRTANETNKSKINNYINYLVRENISRLKRVIINSDEKLTWGASIKQFEGSIITIHSFNEIPETVSVKCQSVFTDNYEVANIVGYCPGTTMKDSFIVFTAHYDHLGTLGSAIFPGANDNASGTALLLELARYFTKHPHEYSIVFISLAAEETGLNGSLYFVEHPLFPLDKAAFLWNFDLAGTGDEGIRIVNSSVYPNDYAALDSINTVHNYLSAVKKRGEACNSDHCPFYKAGVKSFYSYTLGGIKAYHDIYDRYETLPFTAFEGYRNLVIDYIEYFYH